MTIELAEIHVSFDSLNIASRPPRPPRPRYFATLAHELISLGYNVAIVPENPGHVNTAYINYWNMRASALGLWVCHVDSLPPDAANFRTIKVGFPMQG